MDSERAMDRMPAYLISLLASSALVVAAGCASSGRPLENWQNDLTSYVAEHGQGDPNCLRDLVDLRSRRSQRPALITFRSNAGKREAVGVLVAQQQVDSKPWYFFLIGISENSRQGVKLEDVRLVGFTAETDSLHWAIGSPDAAVTERYFRALHAGSVAADDVNRRRSAPRFDRFPGFGDVFDIAVLGHDVSVTERRSGATWQLQVPTARLGPASAVTAAARPSDRTGG